MAEEQTDEGLQSVPGMNTDETAALLESRQAFPGEQPDTPSGILAEAPIQDTSDETPETETPPVIEAEGEQPPVEGETEESGALSLQSLAESAGVDIDAIYGLELATRIDGEDGTATLKDLQKSYQLTGHLTRQQQEHQSKVTEWEANVATQSKQRDEATEALLSIARAELLGDFEKVNWDELSANDPELYSKTFIDYQRRQEEINVAIDKHNTGRAQAGEAQQAEFAEYVKVEHGKVMDVIPQWADEKVRTAEQKLIQADLADRGFSEQEIAGIYDSRQVGIVRDAMRWRELKSKQPAVAKKVKAAPQAVKSGVAPAKPSKADVSQDLMNEVLKSTGRGKSNARAIGKLLDSRGTL
jgi:hypothetical protein